MATDPAFHEPPLDIREQIARIDRMQVEISKWKVEMSKTAQETRYGPFILIFTGMGAAAAFFAAGAAFTKLLIG